MGTDVSGRRAYGSAENLLIMALTCENLKSSPPKGADGKAGMAAEIGRDLAVRRVRDSFVKISVARTEARRWTGSGRLAVGGRYRRSWPGKPKGTVLFRSVVLSAGCSADMMRPLSERGVRLRRARVVVVQRGRETVGMPWLRVGETA